MANMSGLFAPAIAAWVTCTSVLAAGAEQCRLESAAHRVTVIELYTSEGCNSCPPADRWLSGLPQQGVSPDIAVLLAFHVDYWNHLGWPDRFSRATFSDRQRDVATRASSGVIYTPQLVVDGRDFRQGYNAEHLRTKLAAINREQGQAKIRADVHHSANELQISGEVEVFSASDGKGARAWIALFENGLSSRVTAGENAGKQLNHDYVVRGLVGPLSVGTDRRIVLEHRVKLQSDWSAERMGIAIFVERPDTGEILEATERYPLCPS
jgi:hypothetical protein